ncbi:MAG: prepilin-type N-terminal cleavage/methylation domain-containing protein [Candidatus Riflebacteria bacterium]|jgi:prepilin-type N-terminal cleavage/methylation domain-containing protein|nr:prepilin-type N-terminal cleavage/methylation domain-containing protein [Candidatus Riflebacteria bacterium]
MSASSDFNADAARNIKTTDFRLHQRSLQKARRADVSGFSLIEVLLVVLIMGILCGTGVSIYAGVTRDSQTRARTDELRSFFYACRQRASFRKTPVKILFHNQTFSTEQSGSLRLRIPEIDSSSVHETIDIDRNGVFTSGGQILTSLAIRLKIAGNQIETVTIDL